MNEINDEVKRKKGKGEKKLKKGIYGYNKGLWEKEKKKKKLKLKIKTKRDKTLNFSLRSI